MEYLQNLEPLLRTFYYVAIPVTLFFVIQTILTFVGAGASDGLEADFDGDLDSVDAPFQLFTLRNLINFLLGFSWTGISFYDRFENKTLLILTSVIVGATFVALFFFVIREIVKLAEDNSFSIRDTLNKTAQVYLTIPANKMGKGKVQVSARGAIHEVDAITENEKLESGAIVKIVKISSDNLLIVERL